MTLNLVKAQRRYEPLTAPHRDQRRVDELLVFADGLDETSHRGSVTGMSGGPGVPQQPHMAAGHVIDGIVV